MNPCPCGYYGSNEKECKCHQEQIKKYINKISGPLLDRIDLHIETTKVEYKKLESTTKEEPSKEIQKRVNKARNIQNERYLQDKIFCNAQMDSKLIQKYCKLDLKSKTILEKAFNNLGLSARAYTRILKVARTIADLEGAENIKINHISEAIQYRTLDRKYWK